MSLPLAIQERIKEELSILEKYQVQAIDDVTPELVVSLINRYRENELPRLNKLYDYYLGETDITKRAMVDPAKPNNKIVNPFASLITDTVVGYVGGKPIVYQSEDTELMIKLQDVLDRNHEISHNRQLFQKATVMGVAYELLYMNEDAEIGIEVSDPRETFLIHDTTIDMNVLAGVRFIEVPDYITDEAKTYFYIYTEDLVSEYELNGEDYSLLDEYPHSFGSVPVVQYQNNEDMTGSFEKVMTLIDAYDLAVSDTENNLEYFADAYLAITGAEFEEDSEVGTMKENRVLILPEGAKAEWLTKEASKEVEEFKTRLKEDIHQLSQIPNLSDESFSNQQSGEALKYKLFGLENLVSITEGYFKEGIENRLKMVSSILSTTSPTEYDYTSVQITFTRNVPQNLTNLADIASKLVGIISNETLYSLFPFIDDPALEVKRMDSEGLGADGFHDDMEEAVNEAGIADEDSEVEVI